VSGFTTNISGSLQGLHRLQANRNDLSLSLTRLSTGSMINRGADNPAGLISSTQLQSALAFLEAENQSYQRYDQIANTAEASLDEVSGLLSETQGLKVQLANTGALGEGEQAAIQLQIDANTQAIDRITSSAQFNGQLLFDGSMSLSIGDATLDLPSLSSNGIGATEIDGTTYDLSDTASGGALTDAPSASSLILSNAISEIASLRGQIGAFQKDTIASSLTSNHLAYESIAFAGSQIADTDFASETANLIRSQILNTASIKAMGILNQTPGDLLDLLP
jgi:flagellin